MFLKVERTGLDETSRSPVYTETRRYDRCDTVYSFSYSCDWEPEVTERSARNRHAGSAYGDVCLACREVLAKGFPQPRLF